jgi:uncharacterized membrane protein
MISFLFRRALCAFSLLFLPLLLISTAHAQGAKKDVTTTSITDNDHEQERAAWFLHGRTIPGKSAAEMRHRAYQAKMQARAARLARASSAHPDGQPPTPSGGWMPLGPAPLASDATGTGFQDYHQVAGRATAVAIDPADPTGNTIYIGGAQGGVWKSTNAATSIANNVTWSAVTDNQATLLIGSIAIQPGNSNPAQSVILVGTGEADNSADSYFGLGILRSADGGNTWALIPAGNGGLSFSGLGGTRMAFNTAAGQTSTVVAAMAASSEGEVAGALTANTYRGLYTSSDAGQTWTYDSLFSGGASQATSATSVVFNASAGLFFSALRYHGFYSSPDGLTWTRLPVQPGAAGLLSTTACPSNYATTCPIYRAEITVVPGRNEMYVWFVSLDSNGNPVDQGIWQSENSGVSWTQINDGGIINCGDVSGCGVEQGSYNLALLAVPNGTGTATDLYAGAINLYKCSLSSINSTCSTTPFLNLTHVYGCDPLSALAHVHPDQHALAYTIPTSGSDLMYFANDGGIYRALNGFTGLTTGSCSGTNQFDDLNQNLGSMTQFVSFSQHPTDPDTIFGGTQDNGSPATATATTSSAWTNVLSGDGGYNALDPNTGNWFASNPDTGSGSLNIQQCSSGINCNDASFTTVISSADVGGDDGAFYFPYILDPQSTTSLLVGTCRIWQGPRSGGAFTALSLNFETFGTATCAGNEVNVIRALAAGGPTNANGSQVIYSTTDGPGLNNPASPPGGNIWVTTNATAVSGTSSTFTNTTLNGPSGASINSNQFPISSVAIDTSDPTGNTAYVTVMGFTGGPGHIWQTTSAGANWIDFSGTGTNAIPDSPVNAVVVDPNSHVIYVATDVGVFQSLTSIAAWTELGPSSSVESTGFLPNVAVTALAIFNSGGQKLLRASTYGRGVWQYNLLAVPDFEISVPNGTQTIFPGNSVNFTGTLTSLNGYDDFVQLTCTAGTSAPPSPCVPTPGSLTPTPAGAAFSLNAGSSTVGNYNFNLQASGTDPNNTTHSAALTLQVINFTMTAPSPTSVNVPRGATSLPVSFKLSAQGSFNQSVTLSCNIGLLLHGATCTFTPSASFNLTSASPVTATATVTVPAGTALADYTVTLQASTAGAPLPLSTSFTADVVPNPTFVLTEPEAFPNVKAESTGTTGSITISSQDSFTGTVNLSCVTTFGSNSCSISPASVSVALPPAPPATAVLTINGTSFSPGVYQVSSSATSGSISNSLPIPFSVGDYIIAGTQTLATVSGAPAVANLTFTSEFSYNGNVNLTCDATSLPGGACTLSPVSPITIGSGSVVPLTATITVPGSAVAGAYSIKVNTQDATGEPTHQWTISLAVQDFAFGPVTPLAQTIGAGQSAIYNLSVMPVGTAFATPVSLACAGAPATASCTFTPNPVTPGNGSAGVVLTIATSVTTAPGNSSVTVTGASGPLSHSTALSLTVGSNFQLAIAHPFSTAADPGSQQTATISLTPNYTGSVNATCNAVTLSGAQCTLIPPNPIAVSGAPLTITAQVNIPSNAASGTYSINVNVQDATGSPSHSLTLPFTVIQEALQLAVTLPFPTTADANSTDVAKISLTPNYTGSVNASCTPVTLSGAQCTLTPLNPIAVSGAPLTITAQVNIPSNAVAGIYSIKVNVNDANGGTSSSSVQLPFTIAQDYIIANLSAVSQVITAGQSITYNLSAAPVGATYSNPVSLTCSAPLLAGTCSISPGTLSLLGGAAAAVMTVTTPTANSNRWLFPSGGRPWLYAVWLAFALAVFGTAVRRRHNPPVLAVLTLALLFFLTSCGSPGSNGGSTPGGNTQGTPITYTITVMGSPPSISQPKGTTVTLIVDP